MIRATALFAAGLSAVLASVAAAEVNLDNKLGDNLLRQAVSSGQAVRVAVDDLYGLWQREDAAGRHGLTFQADGSGIELLVGPAVGLPMRLDSHRSFRWVFRERTQILRRTVGRRTEQFAVRLWRSDGTSVRLELTDSKQPSRRFVYQKIDRQAPQRLQRQPGLPDRLKMDGADRL